MSTLSVRGRRVASFLLADPRVVAFLTILYIAAGLLFVRSDYTLNDEGLLTHYWASWARQDFVPVFFFQKVKPVLCALYAPFTVGGVYATMAAHVIVSAMAIPMMAATARSLGQALPNVGAIVLAFSPISFYGGWSGLSNIDGAVGVVFVLYLLGARRSPLLAGLVAGALPWVRFELTIFSAAVGLYSLISEGDRRALLGLVIFPAVYALSGAIYHGDPLWLATFPPSAPFDPNNPLYRHQKIGLQYLLEPALAVTPAAAAVIALRMRRIEGLERMILLYGVVAVALVHFLPMFRIGNFGDSPRYSVHVLPSMAFLLGRVLESWWNGQRLGVLRLGGLAALVAWLATRQVDGSVVPPLVALYAVIGVSALLRPGAIPVLATVALAVIGPLLPLRFEVGRAITAAYLDPMAHWLEVHSEQAAGPIYTNSQMLAHFLEARGRPPGSVYFVAGVDTLREGMLLNTQNGQWDRVGRLAGSDLYGRTILGTIEPQDLPADALLALRVESRLPLLFPEEVWGPHLEIVAEGERYRMARPRVR